jgi:voltage-gated sodium channel
VSTNTPVAERRVLTADGNYESIPQYRILWLTRLVYSSAFELVVAAVIATNAVFLAVLTMPGITDETRQFAIVIDSIAMGIYAVELALRILSYGKRPWMFFTRGWNVFDFLIVGLAPFASGQTVVLRLLRLMRLLRIFRFLPEVRVLFASIVKSIPPLLSMSVLIGLLLFLYGMAGTYLFGAQLYLSWGHIGLSLKSLFILLTLENFPIYLEEAMFVSPLALPYFLSYIFFIVFTILNVLIGIVLNAMDEARAENRLRNNDAEAIREISSIVDTMSSDGKISKAELAQLKADIARLRDTIPKGN